MFCQQRFGWGSGPRGILTKFDNLLWDGVLMQMLCKIIHAREVGLQAFDRQPVFNSSIVRKIRSFKMIQDPAKRFDLKLYRLVYSTSSFVSILATKRGYDHSVWIPAPIVHEALPQIIAAYVTGMNAKSAFMHYHSMASISFGITSIMDVSDPSLITMDESDSAAFLAIANVAPTTNPSSIDVSVAQKSGRSIDDAIDLTGDDMDWTGMEVIDLTGDDTEGSSILHFTF